MNQVPEVLAGARVKIRRSTRCAARWNSGEEYHRIVEARSAEKRAGLRADGVLQMATYRPNIGGPPRDTAIYGLCKSQRTTGEDHAART
jgi:hypothetical protein